MTQSTICQMDSYPAPTHNTEPLSADCRWEIQYNARDVFRELVPVRQIVDIRQEHDAEAMLRHQSDEAARAGARAAVKRPPILLPLVGLDAPSETVFDRLAVLQLCRSGHRRERRAFHELVVQNCLDEMTDV